MTEQTRGILHRTYDESLSNAKSIVGSAIYLLEHLKEQRDNVVEEDLPNFDVFCANLNRSIEYRKMTDVITDEITYCNLTITYICRWMNIPADIVSRRKSWESDLTKMLEKAIEDPSVASVNLDLFGVRVILLQHYDYGTLYKVHDTVNKVLAGTDPCLRNNFLVWARDNVLSTTFKVIQDVLETPISILKNKDLVSEPKPNGYQSLHTTMQIDSFYKAEPKLRGVCFEIQYRNLEMHKAAELNPEQKHTAYKAESVSPEVSDVFILRDYSKSTIPGVDNDLDLDGFKKQDDTGKQVATRRTMMID